MEFYMGKEYCIYVHVEFLIGFMLNF
jgi:hypothetical protein